jgi:PAS domain S-box-containing protein
MRIILKIFFLNTLLLLLTNSDISSNNYNSIGIPHIENYSTKDFLNEMQNWTIVQDTRGFIYFGNSEGVLEYDGETWKNIKLTNHSAVRSLSITDNGRIYVGGTKEFGYLTTDIYGGTVYYSLSDRIKKKNFESVWKVFSLGKEIYFFAGKEEIYKYEEEVDSLFNIFIPERFNNFRGLLFDGDVYVTSINHGLGKIVNDSVLVLNILHDQAKKNIYCLEKTTENKILVGTRSDGLFQIEGELSLNSDLVIKPFQYELNEYLKNAQIYSSVKLRNNYIVLTTLRGGIIILNELGKPITQLTKDLGLISNSVYDAYEDIEGNLWFAMEEGISKIELNSPFRKFNELNGLDGSFITVAELDNNFFIGTSLGINYLKESDLDENIVSISTLSSDHIYNLTYCKLRNKQTSEKWLLGSSLRHIFYIDDQLRMKNIIDLYGCYSIVQSTKNEEDIFLGHTLGIHKLKMNFSKTGKPEFIDNGILEGFNENVRHLVLSPEGNIWVSTAYNGIFYIALNNSGENKIYHFDLSDGLPSLNGNYISYINDKPIVITSKQFLTISDVSANPQDYKFIEDSCWGLNKLTDSITFSIVYNDDDDYWFGTNMGIIKLTFSENNKPEIISTPFKRNKNIDVEAILVDEQDNVWIGGRSELFVYDKSFKKSYDFEFKTFFRKIILSKDSIIYNGGNPIHGANNQILSKKEFEYKYNSIRFEFASPFFQDEFSTTYSYRLNGYDDGWSQWSNENFVNYTNLNEGEYTFQVKAKNIFDVNSSIQSFEFDISPPWYRSLVAYLLYIVLLIIIIYLSVTYYTRKLQLEKKKLEVLILKRTKEIEQQKEEIKAQSEQLLKTNKELEKLSIVARKTNNAIVILDKDGNFEWVNEGFHHLYGLSLEEFIKTAGPNIKTASNVKEINDQIKKCFDEKVPVKYEFYTISKHNSEVYVQTSLTPVLDENNEIDKIVAIDSDISKLKLAQKEILKQQEELKFKSEELEKSNKELEKLSIVASETDNAIAILDHKGNYVWINEGYTRLYGFTYDELVKEKDRHFIGTNSNLNLNDLASIWYGDGTAIIYESLIEKRGGEKVWTQTTLTPIMDDLGEIKMLIAIDSDITKLKLAEEKIEAQKAEIEAQRDLAINQRDEISVQKQEIIDSIIYAKRIQNAILPTTQKINEIFDNYFLINRPRDIVSGDFYWFSETDKFKLAAIADCTGHGVPGAFMSIIGITFLNEIVISTNELKANEILNQLRKYVISSLKQTGKEGETRDGMDISIIIYNKQTKNLQYAGANNSIFLVRNKELVEYKADKMPISIHRLADQSFTNNNIEIKDNDLVYLLTDGFADQFGGLKGKKYKIHNFKNLLLSISDLELNEQKRILNKSLDDWKGRLEQVDDILVLGIKF